MDMVAERAASKQVELALLIEEGDIHVSPLYTISLPHESSLAHRTLSGHRFSETLLASGKLW